MPSYLTLNDVRYFLVDFAREGEGKHTSCTFISSIDLVKTHQTHKNG